MCILRSPSVCFMSPFSVTCSHIRVVMWPSGKPAKAGINNAVDSAGETRRTRGARPALANSTRNHNVRRVHNRLQNGESGVAQGSVPIASNERRAQDVRRFFRPRSRPRWAMPRNHSHDMVPLHGFN